MYARVLVLHKADLRPLLTAAVYVRTTGIAFNGTGLVSARFFMKHQTTGVMKVDGAAASVLQTNPLKLGYTWTTFDVDSSGKFFSWFTGYWGADNTIAQRFLGPEIVILEPGASALT